MLDNTNNPDLDEALANLTPERIERKQRTYADIVAKYYGDPDFHAFTTQNTGFSDLSGV